MRTSKGVRLKQAPLHRHWQRHVNGAWRLGYHAGILAPWGHGKTEQLVVARCLHAISLDPNIRIKIICADDVSASSRVASVARYIKESKTWRKHFPQIGPGPISEWSRRRMTVVRSGMGKDPTVEAHGLFSSGLGGRCDILIADDPVDLRSAEASAKYKNKVEDQFRAVWMSRLEPGGHCLYVATRWTQDDLSGTLLESAAFRWMIVRIDEGFKHLVVETPWSHRQVYKLPLWSPKWDEKALRNRLREVDQVAFDRGFRQIPTEEVTQETIFTMIEENVLGLNEFHCAANSYRLEENYG